jgi:hypothetical protein
MKTTLIIIGSIILAVLLFFLVRRIMFKIFMVLVKGIAELLKIKL